jgi:cupin fold WbuC family metalloprotein
MKTKKKSQGVYYLDQYFRKADDQLITFLIKEAKAENLNIIRCCLHQNEESLLMSMLIVIRNKYIYPAHKHAWKDESYTILKGECEFQELDDKGNQLSSIILKRNDTLLNVNKGFHLIKPMGEILAFMETTTGPFKKNGLEFING